jgi:hypothetical protein
MFGSAMLAEKDQKNYCKPILTTVPVVILIYVKNALNQSRPANIRTMWW